MSEIPGGPSPTNINRPDVKVQIAFGSIPSVSPQWSDVTDYVREISIRRGRQHELGRIEGGTCQVVLDNREGTFSDREFTVVNHMTNPSMERDADGDGLADGGEVRVISDWVADPAHETWNGARYGTYYQQLNVITGNSPDGAEIAWKIPCMPNVHYVFRISTRLTNSTKNVYVGIGHRFYHENGTVLVDASRTFTFELIDDAAWVDRAWDGVSPDSASDVEIVVSTWSLGMTGQNPVVIRADGVQIVAKPDDPGQYVDGDATGYYWEGDPNASRTITSPFGSASPVKRLRVSATWRGRNWALFTGFITAWKLIPPEGGALHPMMTVEAEDGFRVLNSIKVSGNWPQEKTGKRVHRVIDATGMSGTFLSSGGWILGDPTYSILGVTTRVVSEVEAYRLVDEGKSDIQAGQVNESALEHLYKVAETEMGLVFINADGKIVFHDRHHRLLYPYERRLLPGLGEFVITAPTKFGPENVRGLGYLPYLSIDVSMDDDWIYNEISLTREGGTEQVAEDVESQRKYLKRRYEKSGLLLTTDSETLSAARWLLATYKDPAWRVEQMEVSGDMDPDLWEPICALEISDRILVAWNWGSYPKNQGSADTEHEFYIEGIEHDISRESWTTRYRLSPAVAQEFWVLGRSRLGEGTRLAY